ncbi:putative thiazole-containing bacteriocin maturation protein [Paenibacillus faecalis]|uniref:putative thiazole-containing bacteriocin maturation protein n=1 Tax=Paenibacillus faecalis TaxID=2079532 RepID=UPI000D0F8C15|nr:putative thiazole-containing bacteriocin maturation protein [Paenibacillus faecalis]
MTVLSPSMRLKVKRDTFFLPDSNGVYFRNHVSSFRMEGEGIDQWIETLIPIFNGEHRLDDLTEGLPDQHRDQVYKIAGVLYRNGFARDVSQDTPHELSSEVLQRYASQIEFLDHFGDSGAYRFQMYRQSRVLVVGSGSFLVSAVSALLDSGLPKLYVQVFGSEPTNWRRIEELVVHARKLDSEVSVEKVVLQKDEGSCWREAVRPFDFILYVSREDDIEELRALHAACKGEKKVFLPAVCMQQAGMAGPLFHPDQEGCWESAWRRVHQSAISKDPELHTFSSTAGAMLANVTVFELFKKITGAIDAEQSNRFFLLNLETLEGKWHSFLPHPLVTGLRKPEWIQNFQDYTFHHDQRLDTSDDGLIPYFSRLTSSESGIFHVWEEGELQHLPLSQCRVQVVDPLSEGPSGLLPDTICNDLTHEEARREAGLIGIEAYVSRLGSLFVPMLLSPQGVEESRIQSYEFIGIGAGEMAAEGICRGLQRCLEEEFDKQQAYQIPMVSRVQLRAVEDKHCLFYLQALTAMKGAPRIALGEEVSGFPVVWVGVDDHWYGNVGLNMTLALRKALRKALLVAQNEPDGLNLQVSSFSSVRLKEQQPLNLEIVSYQAATHPEVLQSAVQVLNQNNKRLLVLDLAVEPFMKEELAGVFGVVLREERVQ